MSAFLFRLPTMGLVLLLSSCSAGAESQVSNSDLVQPGYWLGSSLSGAPISFHVDETLLVRDFTYFLRDVCGQEVSPRRIEKFQLLREGDQLTVEIPEGDESRFGAGDVVLELLAPSPDQLSGFFDVLSSSLGRFGTDGFGLPSACREVEPPNWAVEWTATWQGTERPEVDPAGAAFELFAAGWSY